MTNIDINAMRLNAEAGLQVANAATEGPWKKWPGHPEVFCKVNGEPKVGIISGYQIAECDGDGLYDMFEDTDEECEDAEQKAEDQAEVNAAFIADARTRVPLLAGDVLVLLAEVERLRAENERLRIVFDAAHEWQHVSDDAIRGDP